MLKKYIKGLTFCIVLLISIMMVSTATAVPQTTSNQLKIGPLKSENIKLELSNFLDKIEQLNINKNEENNYIPEDLGDGLLYMILHLLVLLFQKIADVIAVVFGSIGALIYIVFSGIAKALLYGIVFIVNVFITIVNIIGEMILRIID